MKDSMWTEDEILKLIKDREAVLKNLVDTLSKKSDVVFAAKLGFGVPVIDIVTVDTHRTTTGYVLKFPVVGGKINTLPYFQGFGESIFLTDQMFDESFLLVPEMEVSDNTPFTRSPDPLYRLRRMTYESGICSFDRDFNVKIIREPKGSQAKIYLRLKIELFDSILNHGDIVVGEGREERFEEWKKWVNAELERLGNKKYLDKDTAVSLLKQMLQEKNYRSVEMELKESEIEARPRPIPVFEVKGKGLYLGDEKEFRVQLSRISGIILKGDF
jgi:hypothetical protein